MKKKEQQKKIKCRNQKEHDPRFRKKYSLFPAEDEKNNYRAKNNNNPIHAPNNHDTFKYTWR